MNFEHPKLVQSRKAQDGDDAGAAEITEAPKASKKKGKKAADGKEKDPKLFEMQLNGDYLKPFLSFYDPRAMEPPLNAKMVEKIEAKIMKEVEIAIKQVRSSKNLNANLKNNRMTRSIMRKYIDYMEDLEC